MAAHYKCSVCGEYFDADKNETTEEALKIAASGHDPAEEWTYNAEDKTHSHICSFCGEEIDKESCVFNEGEITKEPTETEEGEMTYTCTICGGQYTESIPPVANHKVKRVYGDTRYKTAMLQADELKELLGVDKFDTIIVATGENYADALSGSYLGYVKSAPILLVNSVRVPEVKAYISENLRSGGTVYLLGGEAVVPGAVTSGLNATVKRLFGPTRYETNIEILKEAGVTNEEIMVCDGTNFADSLSASAAKRPILIVDRALKDIQREYLNTLGTSRYYLVGGTGVLPEALAEEIMSKYGSAMRLGGQDRFETSIKVARAICPNADKAVLAYSHNYPDGLCGGTLAAYMDAPLLLVRNENEATISGYTESKGITSGIVLGGPALISDASVRSIFAMADEDEIEVVN